MIRTISSFIFILFLMTSTQIIFDFTKDSDVSNWRIVDDRVMGGISQSYFELTDDGYGRFHGFVTTESNGGFSSVDYDFEPMEVGPSNKVRVRLKGDGKNYQFRVKAFQSDRHNYIKEFETTGDWQTIEINLSEMEPSWRGRKLNMPDFDKNQIAGITILIGNGKKQNFELLIDKIEIIH